MSKKFISKKKEFLNYVKKIFIYSFSNCKNAYIIHRI